MSTSTPRILSLAALSIAMTASAVPPAALQQGRSANGTANTLAQLGIAENLAFLASMPEPAAADSSNSGAPAPFGSPAAGFESNEPAPNTRELIESPTAGKSSAEALGAPVPKMATFNVTGARVPEFRERDVNTRDGMADLSFKRHPGLLVGNAFNLNANAAHEMFLADDWRSTKSDYWDMAHAMAIGGDPAEGRMILQAVKDEETEMRARGGNDSGLPALDRLQVGQLEGDSKLLQAPEDPVDIPFVRVKW